MLKPEDMEPDIGPFDFFIDAFRELSSCRVNSMSLGPIPFTAIVEYSKLFDVGDFSEFLYYIRAMDNVLLGLDNDKQKSKSSSGDKK